jgi:hypothetical protein
MGVCMVNTIKDPIFFKWGLLCKFNLSTCACRLCVIPLDQYFIKGQNILKTLINDFLRKILLYTMKFKYGVLDKFKILKVLVKNQTSEKNEKN